MSSFKDSVALFWWELRFYGGAVGYLRILWWYAALKIWYLLFPHRLPAVEKITLPPKKSRRILLVTSDNGAGSGAFRCAVALAKTLRESNGYEVIVVIPCHESGDFLLREAHVPFVCVPSCEWIVKIGADLKKLSFKIAAKWVRNHRAVLALIRMIHDLDVDLVHSNTTWTYVGLKAARCSHIPSVFHFREMIKEGQGSKILNEPMGFSLMAEASARIAISNVVRGKYLAQLAGVPIERVYDGVDLARFYRPSHQIFKDGRISFVFVGGYQQQKGHDVFCRACVELWRKGVRNFTVLFVGGRVEEHCRHYFEAAGMISAVTFCGMQSEPVRFTEKADVAFVCSRAEGFGLVTVEAMLAGCLVIGADRAGTSELIRHGETGLLFQMSDDLEHGDLVRQIEQALANPEASRRMAAAGRDYMYKNMSLERNADGVARIYEEVLGLSGKFYSSDSR